ncbi:MAG: hypothetical protein RIE24_04495 [Silicimonas sp.]
MAGDIDEDQFSGFQPMSPDSGMVQTFSNRFDIPLQRDAILLRSDIGNRHLKELVAGVSVSCKSGIVHGQKAERVEIVDPHRVGMGKEQAVGGHVHFRFLRVTRFPGQGSFNPANVLQTGDDIYDARS